MLDPRKISPQGTKIYFRTIEERDSEALYYSLYGCPVSPDISTMADFPHAITVYPRRKHEPTERTSIDDLMADLGLDPFTER